MRCTLKPGSGERLGSRAPWLALGFAALWPTICGWIWDAMDPITALDHHLTATGSVPWNETPVIAAQLLHVPFAAATLLPGLLALRAGGFSQPSGPTPSGATLWRQACVVGLATLLVGAAMHLALDLPTGDLGPAKAIARVRIGTRITDTVLHSLGPALFEEAYFRGRLFGAAGTMLPPRATVLLTTLAFAAGHPLELIPFAAVWGVAAGLARLRLGSFWPIVAAHAVWNGIAYADAWMLIG